MFVFPIGRFPLDVQSNYSSCDWQGFDAMSWQAEYPTAQTAQVTLHDEQYNLHVRSENRRTQWDHTSCRSRLLSMRVATALSRAQSNKVLACGLCEEDRPDKLLVRKIVPPISIATSYERAVDCKLVSTCAHTPNMARPGVLLLLSISVGLECSRRDFEREPSLE
jgi:hypothetical protein